MGSRPRLVLTSSPQCALKFLASMSLPRLFPQPRKPFPICHMKILLKPPNIDLEAVISIARAESLFLAGTPTAPGHTALTTSHALPHVKTLMSYVHPPFPSSHSHLLWCEILKAGTNSYSSLDPLPALAVSDTETCSVNICTIKWMHRCVTPVLMEGFCDHSSQGQQRASYLLWLLSHYLGL